MTFYGDKLNKLMTFAGRNGDKKTFCFLVISSLESVKMNFFLEGKSY